MPSPSEPTRVDVGISSDAPQVARPGLAIGDQYVLISRRGRGGIGEVWEARQAPTDRRVAIKLLLPGWQTDQNVRKRFVREGRLASTMQHRHIVDIFEVGESREGMPFIAMELLRGPPLDVVIQQQGPLPWARVKRIMLQICGAVDHSHGLKIVHRDIKPSNIMLDNAADQPDRCKLVDFGIAKQSLVHLQTQHLTGEGQMLGSPGFMSPEQLQGHATDLRGDIYGLGCTGFYLLTGQVPFRGNSVAEMLHNALYRRPHGLQDLELDDRVRRDLEAALHRAVHRDPERRFGSVLEFVVALNHVGQSPGISATSPRYRDDQPRRDDDADADADADSPYEPRRSAPAPLDITATERPPRASDIPTESGRLAVGPRTLPSPRAKRREPADPVIPSSSPSRGVISTQPRSGVITGQSTAERVSWGGPHGFVELARVAPDVFIIHLSGRVGSGAAWLFEQQLGPLLERHRPAHLFWHLGALESYPSDVREASLNCLTTHGGCIASVHVLNGPGLVGMSVSLTTVALGGNSRVYEDHAAWRAALNAWTTGGERE